MILYLDTSALFKLYAAEPGAKEMRAAAGGATAVYTHAVAYPEMCAGFAKAVRLGRLTAAGAAACRRALDRDWEQLNVLVPAWPMMRRAGDLAMRHGLRGYDCVHLAAAESLLAGQDRYAIHFACFDRALNQAAGAIGLQPLFAA